MRGWLGFAIALLALQASPAAALCIYHGAFNVRTTLAQEFRDSRWVVRARVISGDSHWSDEDESWTLYRLEVVQSFKGTLPRRFTFFTRRNSGGFYMDGDGGVPDIGADYLLFLVPSPNPIDHPPAARGSLRANYNCGQSKAWNEVTPTDIRQLESLAGRRTPRGRP